MRHERETTSGVRLITAIMCISLLVLPCVVFAEILDNTTPDSQVTTIAEPGVTSPPATTSPGVLPDHENTTIADNPHPFLILETSDIENLTCTLNGTAAPGSANLTIVSIRWDWGDNLTPEYHGFPYSHTYGSPGTYNLSITALQSDGQNTTRTANCSVAQPVIPGTSPSPLNTSVPGGPGMMTGAPVLTLLEPVIDRMNVTLNGNLNSVSPGVTIESVSVDWNDGNTTKSSDFPITYQYSSPGIFTITITGNQSDGQSTIKRITLDLKEGIPALPQQAASSPPLNNDPPVYLIILATAIIVLAIVVIVQITQRGRGPFPAPDIPKAFLPRAGQMSENLPSPEELETICSGTDVTPGVLDSVIEVAMEIAREGREGEAIGTSFVVGDIKNVLNHSKQFVLNPFFGHLEAERQITDVGIRGNIKEFAQLDGAFLVTGSGIVEAAGRCITVDMSKVNLPKGLGSRHSSVAGITQVTTSIGVVVSQSGGLISIFRDGKIVFTLNS